MKNKVTKRRETMKSAGKISENQSNHRQSKVQFDPTVSIERSDLDDIQNSINKDDGFSRNFTGTQSGKKIDINHQNIDTSNFDPSLSADRVQTVKVEDLAEETK